MGNNLLDVEFLCVGLDGKPIIRDVSFLLKPGEICALIGHNGAGKSITMKSIMGLYKKTTGRICLNGFDQDKEIMKFKQQLTYIPEEPMVFPELTIRQHFLLYSTSYGVAENDYQNKVDYYARIFDLKDKLDEFPHNLSKGMRQKVNVISNLLVDTPLLLVDEPFIGLDIHATQALQDELFQRKKRGLSILLTSHLLDRIRELCDRYVLLVNGAVKETGAIGQLKSIERRMTHE
ncbi:ABC transporter ATP-binding protein [Desmospora activa]|uniref:ABC-2 type transport system ATP-binding protein n=1 Tax=Desmospora activa DSM 45169 TaxID=1121389 RepID=A0A2T4Z7Y0_9BACL|nr:ABC transporter ATP-binding protein [Desmospora activa]PTM57991.1 ABC-2 type transport system ATP-binding protein [Desmospora activa DSM 45169]